MTEPGREQKTLLYFAEEFSTNKAEQFIEQEINFFASFFKEIHVFVFNNNIKDCKYVLAANVKVIDFDLYEAYSRASLLKGHFFSTLKLFLRQLAVSPNRLSYLRRISFYYNSLLHNTNGALRLGRFIRNNYDPKETLFYSFWFNRWMFVLSLAKYFKPHVVSKLITRAHGGDYDETQTKRFFPFRSFQMSQVDVIAPVSKYGEDYIRNKYPNYKGKLKHAYLGVPDRGVNDAGASPVFHLVSCSSLISLKRVHLIIEILKNIEIPLKWTHFGDGPLRNEIEKKAAGLPAPVSFELKGHVPNKDFLGYMQQSPVDLFISTSESEGLPVSLMESVSFGVPILATNVGGVSEIAHEKTGYLVEKDFTAAHVAGIIESHSKKPQDEIAALRKSARQFYLDHFNSNKNYLKFLEDNFNA
jgi:glycosyltransferase involved in cell wall biosynthesis